MGKLRRISLRSSPFLIDCGISSISVTPDTAIAVRNTVAEAEKAAKKLTKQAELLSD